MKVFKLRQQEPPGIISKCHQKLNRIGKISLKNVSKLNEQTQNFLRENTPVRLQELASMNCYAADKIKRTLDKKYGENNYVLVAIGRSVSSIIELIGEMGCNVKIIPLSGLRRYDIDNISQKNLKAYKRFLKGIGLSESDLTKNRDKTYILTDFTYYGRTLNKTETLLKKDYMLGYAPNLISIPISDLLGDDYYLMGYEKLFEYNRFKYYSYVGKLFTYELKNVFNVCSPKKNKELNRNITQGLRKLFWFNVFYSLLKENSSEKKQDKSFTPECELHAIYNHYVSPEACENIHKADYNAVVRWAGRKK